MSLSKTEQLLPGESKFVAAGPHRLHYVEYGLPTHVPTEPGMKEESGSVETKEAPPPIVLVPGLFSSHRQWLRLIPLICPPYRVLAFDYLGVGRSDRPEGFSYTAADQAEALYDALRALGIERAHLVGVSYGGGIVLAMASHHPDLAATVTAIEGIVYWWGLMHTYRAYGFLLNLPVVGPLTFYMSKWSLLLSAWLRAQVVLRRPSPDEVRIIVESYIEPQAERRAWVRLLRTVGEDLRAELARIRTPILYFAGDLSYARPFIRPVLAHLQQVQPSLQLIRLPYGTHNLNVMAPASLAPHLLALWAQNR